MRFLGNFTFRDSEYALYGDERHNEVLNLMAHTELVSVVGVEAMTDVDGDLSLVNVGSTFMEVREV